MNPRIAKVKATDNFNLVLTFTNGEVKIFDVKPYLDKGMFSELCDNNQFNSVRCVLGSIQWSNGLDLCPDTLYEESVPYIKAQGNGDRVRGRLGEGERG
jgi:hypothetical protein